MTKTEPLTYFPSMFATCMLFQVIYVLCVVLWALFPELRGHAFLLDIFPQFKLLDVQSFFYGLIASGVYGWIVSATFVLFYNLWPTVAGLLWRRAA
ncbi:DUF5676 family membrane protein [Hyphomicrobium sp.]|uniref:DUF5676 family membrane protein n=1 Tax=Hyphomicrobium sp. TaxID=82 RepID=UPI000FBA97B0|nr:DUF5676 family membrane protein [Hyphomicrobium sp.]RUO98577.1 MAG: hypothetical protein EKK30_10135 [Hyphomicrobium sp.]